LFQLSAFKFHPLELSLSVFEKGKAIVECRDMTPMAFSCNVKRWIRREAWEIQQALKTVAAEATVPTVS